MVVASQVDLIDWTIFFAPIRELDEAILFRYLRDGADNRVA
jgi:hypothetical protein